MNIKFCGGPYDGLLLPALEVERYGRLGITRAANGSWTTVTLPSPRHLAIIPGSSGCPAAIIRLDGPETSSLYTYELVSRPEGMECHFDGGWVRFFAAER